MKTTVVAADRLTAEQTAAWARLKEADPALESPFLSLEFTRAVAAVRPDVEVAVLEEDGQPAGFFPYQRGPWGVGRPVGGRLSDYQGVVARPGLAWDAVRLVSDCGLSAWQFDHLLACQAPFRPFHYGVVESVILDLSAGFDAYYAARKATSHSVIPNLARKSRKLEREVGPIRLDLHTEDPAAFEALLAWKSAQYVRTRVPNVFAYPWTIDLLRLVLAEKGEAFGGMLSALYAGDRLVAVNLGLRSRGVFHSWFPAYNQAFEKYSPGLVALLETARAWAAAGGRRIDMGKGTMAYKATFGSVGILLADGSVTLNPVVSGVRRGYHHARQWARSSRLGGPWRLVGRWTRGLRGWLAFR
jgi:CelD/BcsL family acetyltransferase involved in cellulose biosynthesis